MLQNKFVSLILLTFVLTSGIAYGSVESSLMNIQSKLITTILPLASILGLIYAGFSFLMGHENAKSHLILAMAGAGIGFGAPSIMQFIRGLIQ